MSRKSARFIAQDLGWDTKRVYDRWEKLGLVVKDGFGGFNLTDKGVKLGGRLSKSRCPVPTFDEEQVLKLMNISLKKLISR